MAKLVFDPSHLKKKSGKTMVVFEGKAFGELGASINLMSYSIFNDLDLGEVKLTSVTLQLADSPLAYPLGINEDVLVKIGKFIYPIDFVVHDFDEDTKIVIILSRMFLVTRRVLIGVEKGELMV